ncbi:MAG: hypothetical protein WA977_06345 [Halobacteriota archaeon]
MTGTTIMIGLRQRRAWISGTGNFGYRLGSIYYKHDKNGVHPSEPADLKLVLDGTI